MSHENFNTLKNNEEIYNMINEKFLRLYFYEGNIHDSEDNIKTFFDLSSKELKKQKVIHFILSREVEDFIRNLPQLVRNLSHSTYHKDEEIRGRVHGKINWNKTIKMRLSSGNADKSLFICSPANKYYNLEENQLVKFILMKIVSFINKYLYFINFKKYKFDYKKINDDEDWYKKVFNYYVTCKFSLRKIYFNEIDTIDKITFNHFKKAFTHKNFLYHYAAKVYRLYDKLFINKDKTVLKDLLEKRIIKTSNSNKLFELYVFSELIGALPGNTDYKLIHNRKDDNDDENRNSITTKLINGNEVTAHYQKTPKTLNKNSKYKKLLEGYDIKGRIRSPDVILEFNSESYRLFEVKNTDDVNYIRDSIYKVMGYLEDFGGECEDEKSFLTKNYPVILIVWDNVKITNENPFDEKIVILTKKDFDKYLNEGVFLND